MKDERDELLDRLFSAARMKKLDFADTGDYFETRLMATLAERREGRRTWSAWSWRLVPWFATLVIIIGIAGYLFDTGRSGDLFATFTGDDEYQVSSLVAGE
ncbi:MAG TPA: hypothetical protein VMJ66_01765 [Geobacteraceae bacterium]|nr:hypothetical protein [Geobacteraceae bacterium]